MAYNNVKVKARQTVAQSNTQTKDLGTVSEVPMGEWNSATPYKKLNLVRYNGATYIATQDNQGATPTGNGIWQLVNADGRGMQSSLISYQASVSGTTPPTGEWLSEVPSVPQGQYLWTRVIYEFTDETETTAYSVSLQGLNFTQQDRDDIDRITDAIPSTASAENPLATHDFVNSSINSVAAYYITPTATGDEAFATHATLVSATTFYNGGQLRVPTQNDYAIVQADETQTADVSGKYPTTRYSYQGGTYPNGQWEFQYIVNNTTLTNAQINAINSGITSSLVTKLNGIEAGAQKNTITGVKGANETSYRTGNVNLTSANIGAVNKSGDMMTGALTCKYVNDFISHGNEFNFGNPNGVMYLQYRDAVITEYRFCNGDGTGGLARVVGKELYENDQRVYSPNNRPTSIECSYTTDGGQEPPSYVGTYSLKCNMMSGFTGLTTPNLSGYMDVILMNAYDWSDVPYATAIGVGKNVNRAWIARGGNTNAWTEVAEIYTSANLTFSVSGSTLTITKN